MLWVLLCKVGERVTKPKKIYLLEVKRFVADVEWGVFSD